MLQLRLSSPPCLNPMQNPHCPSKPHQIRPFNGRSSKSYGLSVPHMTSTLRLKCRQSDYIDNRRLDDPPSTAPAADLPPRFYVGHSIYKGKAALTLEPRAPEFVSLESGAFKLSKEGFVLLQFAPANGVRQYDWSRKQVFSLSVSEIGNLVGLGARESCEFFHDPLKGKSDEGKVRKVLKVEPLPDGSGRFFNLSVQNRLINLDESIYIPVSRAEYTVLTCAFSFLLPYLIGWHAFANSIRMDESNRANSSGPKYGGDYEWSR